MRTAVAETSVEAYYSHVIPYLAQSQNERQPFKGKDLAGMRFSRLTVLHRDHASSKWICICECGTKKSVRSTHLTQGATRSCGCLQKEWVINYNTKHGKTGSDLFDLWRNLFSRCYTTTNPAYPNYGGRGIKVCDRWHEFENFLEDMGVRPPETSIDRIDNHGPYSPENCRWATRTEQARNMRSNRLITFQGKTKCVAEWASELGISGNVICSRLDRYGWPVERALKTPVGMK